MKRVIFHGVLKAFKKGEYLVKANSWKEICESMQANFKKYASIRKKLIQDIDYVYFLVDGMAVENVDILDEKIKAGSVIEVIPVVAQAVKALLLVVVKLVITFAIAFAISYLVAKLLTPKDPKQIKTSSYIIDGKTNIAARNTPIPIGYGRLRVAPPVISVFSMNFDI